MYFTVTSNSYSNKSILMYLVGVYLGFLPLGFKQTHQKKCQKSAGIERKLSKLTKQNTFDRQSICGLIELKIDMDVNNK
jgi:hypothetical protein